MPDFFAGYEIIAQTKNFLVTSESDPGARQRATWIGQVCEADLARLNDLFSTNFEAGNTSPHTIWVIVLADDPTSNANGFNYGYETAESSRIFIRRAFTPPPPPPPPLIPPDPRPLAGPNLNLAIIEFPRFVFVAELAEILMQFTGYGWDPAHSPGEGLSNLLGALLHPAGYYDTNQGPRINQWLNGQTSPPVIAPRTDYVTQKLDTDKDIFSYGCAILFINYLVSQRGYSLKAVIRAGGSTLAETFANLTREFPGSGFNEFNALLQAHLGSSTTNNLRRDNPFPLLDTQLRSLQVDEQASIASGEFTDPHPVAFNVKPGIACPVASYTYSRHRSQVEQPIFLRARGFANAVINWNIDNIIAVGPTVGPWTTITVATPLTVKDPDGAEVVIAEQVTLQWASTGTWNALAVFVRTVSTNGNFDLTLRFSATEAAFTKEPAVLASDTPTLTTVSWIPGDAFVRAFQKCNPYYVTLNQSFWYLTAALADFKNRPDPDPVSYAAAAIIRAVELVQRNAAQFARATHLTPAQVIAQLALPGLLRSQDPAPLDFDLTRLPPTASVPPTGAGRDFNPPRSEEDPT